MYVVITGMGRTHAVQDTRRYNIFRNYEFNEIERELAAALYAAKCNLGTKTKTVPIPPITISQR